MRKGLWSHDSSRGTEKNTVTSTLASLKVHFSRVVLQSMAWRKHSDPCCQTQTGGHWTQPNLFWQKAPSCKTTETSGLNVVNGETRPNTVLPKGLFGCCPQAVRKGPKCCRSRRLVYVCCQTKCSQDCGKISGKEFFASQKGLVNTLQSDCQMGDCFDFQVFQHFLPVCPPERGESRCR